MNNNREEAKNFLFFCGIKKNFKLKSLKFFKTLYIFLVKLKVNRNIIFYISCFSIMFSWDEIR